MSQQTARFERQRQQRSKQFYRLRAHQQRVNSPYTTSAGAPFYTSAGRPFLTA
jgi:hypothetical protein